jgi:hypothetical protein
MTPNRLSGRWIGSIGPVQEVSAWFVSMRWDFPSSSLTPAESARPENALPP